MQYYVRTWVIWRVGMERLTVASYTHTCLVPVEWERVWRITAQIHSTFQLRGSFLNVPALEMMYRFYNIVLYYFTIFLYYFTIFLYYFIIFLYYFIIFLYYYIIFLYYFIIFLYYFIIFLYYFIIFLYCFIIFLYYLIIFLYYFIKKFIYFFDIAPLSRHAWFEIVKSYIGL